MLILILSNNYQYIFFAGLVAQSVMSASYWNARTQSNASCKCSGYNSPNENMLNTKNLNAIGHTKKIISKCISSVGWSRSETAFYSEAGAEFEGFGSGSCSTQKRKNSGKQNTHFNLAKIKQNSVCCRNLFFLLQYRTSLCWTKLLVFSACFDTETI